MDVLSLVQDLLIAVYDSVNHPIYPSISRTSTSPLQVPLQMCHFPGRTILWEYEVMFTF